MSKHTHGPWHLDVLAHTLTDTGDYDNRWIVRDNNRKRIADMFEEGDEADANAHLIASAPELLDALNEAPVPSKYHGIRGFETNRFLADYEEWMEKRRGAIAKAEGR